MSFSSKGTLYTKVHCHRKLAFPDGIIQCRGDGRVVAVPLIIKPMAYTDLVHLFAAGRVGQHVLGDPEDATDPGAPLPQPGSHCEGMV